MLLVSHLAHRTAIQYDFLDRFLLCTMAKRDPEKTARNKKIAEWGATLKEKLPGVLEVLGLEREGSLHGIYGGKHADFIDIKHAVIHTPEQFVALWQRGYMDYLRKQAAARGPYAKDSNYYKNFRVLQEQPKVWEYVELFLKRTFLRNYESLARTRPTVEQSAIWIGQNNASYGLLVTPRFYKGVWDNDKSEIRHFPKDYWTIGHILETGFVIPGKERRIEFNDVEDYLTFFENVIVRASGSVHEAKIAEKYSEFVRAAPHVEKVPLLIPELRYAGLARDHKYRLDFCIIHPFTMERVGFELSPWSTHGQLTGTKGMTQKAINDMAKANFESEMKKLKAYYRDMGIHVLVYTDSDLQNPGKVFGEIAGYLNPEKAARQLQLAIRDEFMHFDL